MIFIAIILGCAIGILVGNFAPIISYTYSGYLAIAIVAALDSVFGGINSSLNKKFDMAIFLSGFFGNAVLAILLAYLGQRLNVDIYLVAIFVFVTRMFNNLAGIRRFYLEKFRAKAHKNKSKKD
ncbi:MAG: small basic family protein [Clostridia bacterium]|nr:small basic family protein [Clostridia bacterium]MBR4260929.1 small basic family protein [Clostridia bacterium]